MKLRSGLIPLAVIAAVVIAGCGDPSPSPSGAQQYTSIYRSSEVELSERTLGVCQLMAPRQRFQNAQLRAVALCAAAQNYLQRIVISPDFARGHIADERCSS
jgi:hypothetical protein